MNTDTKILNNISANWIPQCIKKIIHHNQMRFILGMQGLNNIHKSMNVIHHINKMKDKNHMIISIDRGKAFDKIYTKNSQQSGIRKNIPKHNKGHIWQTHCQHHIQQAKTTSIPFKIRNKTEMYAFTSLIQHSTGSLSHSNQTRKRNKRHPNWKGRSKTVFICRWSHTVHRQLKDSTKKLLELINEFSKVAGYKINIQKSVAFLYTNNELSERERN